MPESKRHKQLKNQDAGVTGQTEVTLPSGARLDALTGGGIAVEIERSGSRGIQKSVETLKEAIRSGIADKARLRVPQQDMGRAIEEMQRQGVEGQVTNLGGTQRKAVAKTKK